VDTGPHDLHLVLSKAKVKSFDLLQKTQLRATKFRAPIDKHAPESAIVVWVLLTLMQDSTHLAPKAQRYRDRGFKVSR
jgi:hypothetical protein